jgi:acyltransferase
MRAIAEEKRIWLIDIARFYAIALVFYGHFIERVMILKNPAAAVQYKFIYSFHMMLFFVLAGYVARESDVEFGFGKYLKYRFLSRLLPFLFFTAIFMMLPVFFSGDFFNLQLPSVQGYIDGLISTVFGLTMFCVPS